MYTLTRFLYPLDEVELSFIHCLLNKANLQECYFWIFEIHFSGFDVFPFLWKVYLDFYKELNSISLEDYIIKKNEEFLRSNDDVDIIIKSIASIVRNLFKAVPSPNTFFLRQYFAIYKDKEKDMNNEDDETMMLLADNINLLTINNNNDKNDDAGCQPLLNAIDKSDFENICYYLYDSSSSSIIDIILLLLSPSTLIDNTKKSSLVYSNPLHYLLALCIINKKSNNNNNTINKTIFVVPTEADLKMIRDTNELSIPLSKYGLPQIYNTLKIKRLFSISDKIACFNLKRYSFIEEGSSYSGVDDNYIDFLTEIWNHWEYYAMRSPLWLNRLPKECSIDHIKREIVFPLNDEDDDADADADADADIKEQFYELYGYELDEQCKEVMDMSHKELSPSSIKDWFAYNASSNINLYYLIALAAEENISFNY